MIVSIGGIKGGAGKTTLAVNIAVTLSIKKKRVLLIDSDNQKSSIKWSIAREEIQNSNSITVIHLPETSVISQVKKMEPDYDDVIIDVGGRDNTALRASMLICDIFLTPFRPRSLDIWTLNEIELLLKEGQALNPKMKAFSVINQADPRGSDNRDSKKILAKSDFLIPVKNVICQRKVFSNSIAEGLGVLEYSPVDKKAKKELKTLISFIYRSHKN